MAEEFRVLRPYEFHCQLISKGRRADGRLLDVTRTLKYETDAIQTADSSSLVKIGNTSLACGCTTRVITAKECLDSTEDLINIRVELPPICSSPTTGYRTQNAAHILTKNLKTILEDTECLDRSCLFIEQLDCYWSVSVEVVCLNYDGSLLDASLIAVLAALSSLNLKSDTGKVPDRKFSVKHVPICTSFAIIGEHFICDPNLEEESISESIFAITTSPQEKFIVNKVGGKSINLTKLARCIELSRKRADQVRQQLTVATSQYRGIKMDCT